MSLRIPVHVELEAVNTRAIALFEHALGRHPSIEEYYAVAGKSDYLLFVTVSDFHEFQAIHRNVLARLPGVRKVRSEIPLRRVRLP